MAKKNNTKNSSVVDEDAAIGSIKGPPDGSKDKQVVTAVFSKFRDTATHRDAAFENFGGLNLVDYVSDSVRRFITNVDERTEIEDWQARVHDPFTRNKTLAILSRLVQVLPIAEFTGRGDEDFRKGEILTDLYQYSEDLDDYEELMINVLLEAITKGTAIGYEGQEQKTNSIREVSGSGDDITVTESSLKTNRLYGTLVPLEDFYPSSVGVRKIKEMPFCFWRTVIPHQQFLQDYAMFDRAKLVQPQMTWGGDIEQKPYYLDFISDTVQNGQVEILRYYNKDVDEYVMIANGVWLNPIKAKAGIAISPLPFTHKELPFWDIRFELFVNFFYGKSLPDKLASLQDVLNVLTNMLLDQSFMTIFPPMLTAGFDSIEDDYMRPGRRTPIDTQGLSIKDQYMILEQPTPTGWHQFILQYTRRIMEEASVDQVSQGVAGVGGRTTAEEIQTAAAGVMAIIGLFGRLVKYGLKRKALLRAKNILQFWTDPNFPVINQALGEAGAADINKAFNVFKVDNVPLTSGKRGTKIIEMYADRNKAPTKRTQKARGLVSKLSSNREVEYVALDPSYIRSLDFDVKLGINQKAEETKDMEKALQLEKVRVYKSFFPNIVDDNELFAQTAEKMGDDPLKLMKPEIAEQLMGAKEKSGAENQMQDTGMSTLPNGNIANEAMQKAMKINLQNKGVRELQTQMLG